MVAVVSPEYLTRIFIIFILLTAFKKLTEIDNNVYWKLQQQQLN